MVRIRLMRSGTKRRPFYKVVVSDSKSPRDGKFIEIVGRYHPMDKENPVTFLDDRIDYWFKNGAQPTRTVSNLLRKKGLLATQKVKAE